MSDRFRFYTAVIGFVCGFSLQPLDHSNCTRYISAKIKEDEVGSIHHSSCQRIYWVSSPILWGKKLKRDWAAGSAWMKYPLRVRGY
mgnify:FL=1